MKELIIYSSKASALKLMLIAIVLVLLGYFIFLDAEAASLKWYTAIFLMLFFGIALGIAIYKFIRPSLQVKITASGIYLQKKEYKWEDIARTRSEKWKSQTFFTIYLNSYEYPGTLTLIDYKNRRKGNIITTQIDSENTDLIALENLTEQLRQRDVEKRQQLIFKSKITKDKKNYLPYFLLLMLYVVLTMWSVKFLLLIGLITTAAVLIQEWFYNTIKTPKWTYNSEMFALIGFVYLFLLGFGFFMFINLTNSIGVKLTTQIENYNDAQQHYPASIDEIEDEAKLNSLELLLLHRISYQQTTASYSLSLKKLNAKTAEFDAISNEWK